DESGRDAANWVVIGTTGYQKQGAGAAWSKSINEGFRRSAQIFRPLQISVATSQPGALPSGVAVEWVEENGQPALHAVFEYGDSEDLRDLGIFRSSGNQLDVVLD